MPSWRIRPAVTHHAQAGSGPSCHWYQTTRPMPRLRRWRTAVAMARRSFDRCFALVCDQRPGTSGVRPLVVFAVGAAAPQPTSVIQIGVRSSPARVMVFRVCRISFVIEPGPFV